MNSRKRIMLAMILSCVVAILVYCCWFKIYVQDSGCQEKKILEVKDIKTVSGYPVNTEECINEWKNGIRSLKETVNCLDRYSKQVNNTLNSRGDSDE